MGYNWFPEKKIMWTNLWLKSVGSSYSIVLCSFQIKKILSIKFGFWLIPLIVIIIVLSTFIISHTFNIDKHCYVLSEKRFSEQEWRAFKIFITYKLYLKRDGVCTWYMYNVHKYMCYITMTWHMTFYTCYLPYVILPDLQYPVL